MVVGPDVVVVMSAEVVVWLVVHIVRLDVVVLGPSVLV